MEIRLLGPVEASLHGTPVGLGTPQQRAVLAMLALEANRPVPADRLIDGLWGERAPASARKLVQVHVSRLRKRLGGDDAPILTRGRGYELRVDADCVDALRFGKLVGEAARAGAAGNGTARDALALWRGPALADVAGEPFADVEIRRLEELRLQATEIAIDSDLAAGRHAEVLGELDALVTEHPVQEHLWAQRMLALYRAGRQADALAAYRAARTALVEGIGVGPGPELRRLHEAILRQDRALDLGTRAHAGPGLPAELDAGTPLVGRDEELAGLRDHWKRARDGAGRVVLLAGGPGMGKTRLAAALAAEVRRDGGTVVYASPETPPDVVLAALDAGAGREPGLLVVDDVDGAAGPVRAAVAAAAQALPRPLLVLATGDDALRVLAAPGAALVHLGRLDAAAVEAIARRSAGADLAERVPVQRLLERSGGVPALIHREAAAWAHAEVAARLGADIVRAGARRAGWRAAQEDLAGRLLELRAVRDRLDAGMPASGPVACPYRGLATLGVDDADVFFGRELLEAELLARLAGAPLLGIVGPSGSGKSSLLRAGLLATLRRGALPGSEAWAVLRFRPGADPVGALESARARAGATRPLVLAVDQFEETFTACGDEARRTAFVDALVAAVRDPGGRTQVVLTVRADFYGRCAAHPELARLLAANQVLVGPMRRDELRRAIALPARRAGVEVDPELVDALVADVEGEPGALPLLSAMLVELWERRDGRRLRLRAYRETGGVRGAVGRLAERTYGGLDEDQRVLARRILLRLAGEGDGETVVRRRAPLAELSGGGDGRVGDVLAVLAADRLVTIGDSAAEVAHEALLREWPRLRSWLEEDVHGRRLHHHLRAAATGWEAGGRERGELYRGARLAAALDWSASRAEELAPAERSFLEASRDASRSAQRRLHGVLAGVVGLLVLTMLGGLAALDQRGAARDEARAADAQRLGARALAEDDLDTALLLARQGVALGDTAQTRGNLMAALVERPAALGVLRGDGARMWRLGLSPDGRTLAAGDASGSVFLLDTRSRRRIARFEAGPGDAWVTRLAFSSDGRRLAVGHDTPTGDNVVSLFDARSRRLVRRLEPPPRRWVSGLRFAPGGALDVLTITQDSDGGPAHLTRFDAGSGRRLRASLPVNRRGRSPLLTSADGSRVVTAGDGEVVVRDDVTLRALRRHAVPGAGESEYPASVALAPDGRTLALGDATGALDLVDLDSGERRRASGRHAGAVTAVAFTPDGRTVATGSEDGAAMVWDAGAATSIETLSGHASAVSALELTGDGRTLYTAGTDGAVFVWDLAGTRRLGRPFDAGAGNPGRPHLALSSDGRLAARSQDDGAIIVVDLRTLERRAPIPVVETGQARGIAFVPGGHRLVVGGPDGFLALVDVDAGRVLRRLEGHTGAMYTPGISADGRLLATSGDLDDTVRLWSLPDGRQLGPPLRFRDVIWDAQLSPDGRHLTVVLVGADFEHGAVEVIDTRTRRRVRRLAFDDWPGFARFSPDGRLMAVGTRRGRSRVFSTATWRPVTRVLAGDAGGVESAAFSPDNRILATGTETGTVRLWDIATEQPLGSPLPSVPGRAALPYFTRDGTRLIVSSDTGRAHLWDIRPASLERAACRIANRRLTRAEWERFLPGRAYDPAC